MPPSAWTRTRTAIQMAEAAADRRRVAAHPGLASRLLTSLAQALKWLLLSLVFSIGVEWLGMVLWWPDEGLAHSREMLARELAYLDRDFQQSLVTADPARFAGALADGTYHWLFERTRLVDGIRWLARAPTGAESGLRASLHTAWTTVAPFVLAVMQVTQVFAVRLAVLVLAMPVFVLLSLVALVDGLVQRDLRRWGGGRESSFVYHYAKRAALPLVVLTWVIYLALPVSVHPTFVVLPFATLFALTVAVTASTFKKYL